MMSRHDLVTASLLASVVWNLAGFAIRSYDRLWPAGPLPVRPITALLTAGTVLGVPLSRSRTRYARRATASLGGLMTAWSLVGLATLPPRAKLGPVPALVAPGLAAIFGSITLVCSWHIGLSEPKEIEQGHKGRRPR